VEVKRSEIVSRVRVLTRDLTNSIFRIEDILDFINEGIDRCRQLFVEFNGMMYLSNDDDVPQFLPSQYHSLLAVYATARCFAQDEREYKATTYMNEFEQKMDELRVAIQDGRVIVVDGSGNPVTGQSDSFYVSDNYYFKNNSQYNENFDYPTDPDLGV
jgi:hypothetical protein